MELINEIDVFKACCGEDEEGNPKSIIAIEAKVMFDTNGEEIREEALWEKSIFSAVVNLQRAARFTTVDLTFDSPLNVEFLNLVGLLQDFSKPSNSINNESVPCIFVTVMPNEFEGDYYLTGMGAAWCLMPSKPNSLADTVRFIFDNDLFSTYFSEFDEEEELVS